MNIRIVLISLVAILLIGGVSYAFLAPSKQIAPAAENTQATSSTPIVSPTETATTSVATSTVKVPTTVKTVKTTTTVTHTTPPPVVIVSPPQPQPATTSPVVVAGYGNLVVSSIPLLSGGDARPGSIIPVSYLQVNNTGTTTVKISGFKLKENGLAPDVSIIGLQTVDEKGGSRGYVGGSEATTPFVNGIAEASTYALIGPGQMKLFTVKVQLSAKAGQYAGSQIIISVTGLNATATVKGSFPIAGTTWAITQ